MILIACVLTLANVPAGAQPPTGLEPIADGRILAKVGQQVVLASDLMWQANQLLERNAAQIPPEHLPAAREQVLEVLVGRTLDTQLLLNDVLANAPPEVLQKLRQQLGDEFEKSEIQNMQEQMEVTTRQELDVKLRQGGGSIELLKTEYINSRIALIWLGQQSPPVSDISRDELLKHYHDHIEEYEYPARCRWQEIMVEVGRFGGNQDAARNALGQLGNEIWKHEHKQGGRSMNAVAKTHSHGVTAAQGGVHDWTVEGSLRATQVDQAIFSLQVGELSPIIKSDLGLHIVKVLERKPAGRTPFEEAQADIRKKLGDERRIATRMEYLEDLRENTIIWTQYTGRTTAKRFAQRQSDATRQ